MLLCHGLSGICSLWYPIVWVSVPLTGGPSGPLFVPFPEILLLNSKGVVHIEVTPNGRGKWLKVPTTLVLTLVSSSTYTKLSWKLGDKRWNPLLID